MFAVSRSVRFGKFGGRCKSSQCRGCVQRGFLFMLVVVHCRLLQWDQSAKEAMVPTLIVPYRGGTGVSAHQPFNDPWLMSQQLPDKTTANQSPPKNKLTNKQKISGAATRVRFFLYIYFLHPERVGQLLSCAPKPWGTWSSVWGRDQRGAVSLWGHFSFFAKRTSLVLGPHCPFWPHGTSHDRTLHGLHRPWPLKVTATRHLGGGHNAGKVQTDCARK